MSGPNTGTELHLDPLFAQSWNTLVSGHKMWALLPPDTEHRLLECDPKCSGHDKVDMGFTTKETRPGVQQCQAQGQVFCPGLGSI